MLINLFYNTYIYNNMTDLIRPAFKSGTIYVQKEQVPRLQKNKRAGLGNFDMTRNNFNRPEIRPRAVDFDKLQAIDIETQGAKIQLGDKTFSQLFSIKIPDPQDTKWLAEKLRLTNQYRLAGYTPLQIKRELDVNKPLGREQRKINSVQTITETSLSMSEKLGALETEIKDGRAESVVQQNQLMAQFAVVLNDITGLANLTQTEINNLGTSLSRLGVPTDYKQLGIVPKYIDLEFYNKNPGIINLLLFSKVRESTDVKQYNYDLMVKNYASHPVDGLPAIKLVSMTASMRKPVNDPSKRYLDLERGGVISAQELTAIASKYADGFNNSDFAISDTSQLTP